MRAVPWIVLLGVLGIVALSIMLWNLVGSRVFALTPDPELIDMTACTGALTGQVGLPPNDVPPIRTSMALGLLPGGVSAWNVRVAGIACSYLPAMVLSVSTGDMP
ncbi:MAG: hypothetical protein IPM33_07155 [Phycisphaerales bacterium]|nr:hypothetical protein [Phycisphaerales bacterium]